MTTQELIESTIAALVLTAQPDNRTCKVRKHLPRESFGPLPYRYKLELENPLAAPKGARVVLKMTDATGKVVSVPGVIADHIDPSEIHDCQRGKAVMIGTSDPISGNCVALEWDATAGQQAVGEKLKVMLMPDGISNAKLFAETFNLPNHTSIGDEPQNLTGVETSRISPSNLPISEAKILAEETALPPTKREELDALHLDTAAKDVVFVLAASDTIAASTVAAHLAQKICAPGRSALVVGRNGADVKTTRREWAEGLTNTDGASDTAVNFTREFGLHWQGADDRLWDFRKHISEVDAQIAGLIHQAQAESGGSESSDKMKDLVATRESLIKELQSATREQIQSTPLVFAKLDSALICPALLGRTFDVVIILDAKHVTVPELMVLVGLAKTAVRIIGDCREFSPSPYEPGSALHEFLGRDVFEFCGVTRNLDRGAYDPRMATLRYQRNTHPEVTRVVSHVVYGGLLVATKNSQTENQPGLQAGGVVVWDTSSFDPVAFNFGHPDHRFSPVSLALGISACALRLPNCGGEHGYHRCAVITPYRNQQRLYKAMLRDQGLDIQILTPGCSINTPVDQVIVDLTPSSGEATHDWKLHGGAGSYAFHLVRTALTSTRHKAVILVDKSRLKETLPADATLRRLLQEIERTSGPAISFPENILVTPEFLETPNCSVYLNESAAWETIYRDIARAQTRVTWCWPQDVAKLLDKLPGGRLLIRGDGIKQTIVADIDVATVRELARQGVRVTAPRRSQAGTIFIEGDVETVFRSPAEGQPAWVEDPRRCDEPCILIDENVLWFVGTAREQGRGRPYIRFKGSETVRLLTGFFGLDDVHGAQEKSNRWSEILDPRFP